jgi:hypothetical protein
MMSKKKLPKMVFVRWNEECDDDPFLDSREKPQDFAELEDSVVVGQYKSYQTVKVSNKTTVD